MRIEHYKNAFTLVELSVVVVIISVMLSTVLVSRSLIMNAKNNKIQEEYRNISNSVNIFYNTYDCFPGDCKASQIPDLLPMMPNYVPPSGTIAATSLCTTPVTPPSSSAIVLNNGMIDTTAKRTCMMLQLQAGGYIQGLNYVYGIDLLQNTVSGRNIPYVTFTKNASWDYRYVTGSVLNINSGTTVFPQVNGLGGFGCGYIDPATLIGGYGAGGYGLAPWCGNHALVLRNTNVNASLTSEDIVGTATTVAYAITAVQAQRLDLKFDDGLPYFGNISGVRNAIDTLSATSIACTILAGQESNGTNLTNLVAYQVSNDITKGCIVSYLVKTY